MSKNKTSLTQAFNVKPKHLDLKDVKDYDIFPDKSLLEKLRNKIIQNLIDEEFVGRVMATFNKNGVLNTKASSNKHGLVIYPK